MNFDLSQEQIDIQALAKKFTKEVMIPQAAYHDQTGEYPLKIIQEAWKLGLMNTHIPAQYGGLGLGVLEGCIITLRPVKPRHSGLGYKGSGL